MKNLNNYIIEKLKINKDNKTNYLIDEIIETWGVEYYKDFYKKYHDEIYDILKEWINDNKVKEVEFYCPAWGINIMEEHKIPKHIRDKYIPCNDDNSYVYDYLKNNPEILIDAYDIFIDKDRNKHGIYLVTDHKNIISFNVEGCAPRICHKENT